MKKLFGIGAFLVVFTLGASTQVMAEQDYVLYFVNKSQSKQFVKHVRSKCMKQPDDKDRSEFSLLPGQTSSKIIMKDSNNAFEDGGCVNYSKEVFWSTGPNHDKISYNYITVSFDHFKMGGKWHTTIKVYDGAPINAMCKQQNCTNQSVTIDPSPIYIYLN